MKSLSFFVFLFSFTLPVAAAQTSLGIAWGQVCHELKSFTDTPCTNGRVDGDVIAKTSATFNVELPLDIQIFYQNISNGASMQSTNDWPLMPFLNLLPMQEWGGYLIQHNDSYREWLHQDFAEQVGEDPGFTVDELNPQHPSWKTRGAPIIVIGVGAVDYDQEILLNTRTGHLYEFVHNIPRWRNLGTLEQWITASLKELQNRTDRSGLVPTGEGDYPELKYWLPLPKP